MKEDTQLIMIYLCFENYAYSGIFAFYLWFIKFISCGVLKFLNLYKFIRVFKVCVWIECIGDIWAVWRSSENIIVFTV